MTGKGEGEGNAPAAASRGTSIWTCGGAACWLGMCAHKEIGGFSKADVVFVCDAEAEEQAAPEEEQAAPEKEQAAPEEEQAAPAPPHELVCCPERPPWW